MNIKLFKAIGTYTEENMRTHKETENKQQNANQVPTDKLIKLISVKVKTLW
jgi:hypothetical protein